MADPGVLPTVCGGSQNARVPPDAAARAGRHAAARPLVLAVIVKLGDLHMQASYIHAHSGSHRFVATLVVGVAAAACATGAFAGCGDFPLVPPSAAAAPRLLERPLSSPPRADAPRLLRIAYSQVADEVDMLASLLNRRHPNIVAVALANKNARTVWALLAHGREFRAHYAPEISAA